MITSAVLLVCITALLGVRFAGQWAPARSLRQPRARQPRAWRRASPAADEFAEYLDRLAREVRSGRQLAAALVDVPAPSVITRPGQRDHPDVAVVEHTIAAATRLGGAVGPALDAAAAVLRERAAMAAEAFAQGAQARLSARILTLVPIGFALSGMVTSPRTRAAYLQSTVGIACATVGLMLNIVGWWWMRHIVRGST